MAKRQPVRRVVLMEFAVPPDALGDDAREALVRQLEDVDGKLPDPLTVLVPVAESEGGPKEVIRSAARAPGTFRAPPFSSWGGARMVEPPQMQLIMEDLPPAAP